jgi:hypothetical protein
MHTLGEAARLCGVAKGTISKAIKTGKLSATRRADGSWSIDNAELARYRDANGHRFRSATGKADQVETAAATEVMIAELRTMLADTREDRDRWRSMAERLAIAAPQPEQPIEQPPSWWTWLRTG